MSSRTLIKLFALISIGYFAFAGTSYAIDYTTQAYDPGSAYDPAPASTQSEPLCTSADMSEIRRFDSKARTYAKKFYEYKKELIEMKASGLANAKTTRQGQKIVDKGVKAMNFFVSPEYKKMEVVYERCGKTIPALDFGPPVWALDGTMDMGSACPSCAAGNQ